MINLKNILTENSISGKTFISVDIQPEYESVFGFNIDDFCNFINENDNIVYRYIFLYNGEDTLGMSNKEDYSIWLMDHGMREDVIDSIIFYDKGYAFFRSCMDRYIDEDVIVDFVSFLYKHDITDSRDMTLDLWKVYLKTKNKKLDKKEIHQLLYHEEEMINIPDLMDFLKSYSNIILTGGGVNECLKEVEIALKVLNKPYVIDKRFTY